MRPVRTELGFTLVEMIVALLIFALLASAGVGLLRASVDTQAAVREGLAEFGSAARLRTLLQSDVSQAVVRPVAGAPSGFAGDASSLLLVRLTVQADRQPGSTGLQAVRWSLQGDGLARETIAADGTVLGRPAVLARNVQSFGLRYRGADGRWSQGWSSPPHLPAAIELRLQRRGEAPVTMIAALPQGPAETAQPVAPGSGA